MGLGKKMRIGKKKRMEDASNGDVRIIVDPVVTDELIDKENDEMESMMRRNLQCRGLETVVS